MVATGVQFTRDGKRENRKARNEVILCAGVFLSPQLLEVSGIGSSKLLRSYGVEVVVGNTNVGKNLQDHPVTKMSFEVVDGLPMIDMICDLQVIQAAVGAYQSSHQGPLTSGFHSVASLSAVEFLSEKGKSKLTQLLDTYAHVSSTSQDPSQFSDNIM